MAPKPGRATEASKVVKGLPYLQGPLPNEEQSHGGWEWLSPKMARADGEEDSLSRAGGHQADVCSREGFRMANYTAQAGLRKLPERQLGPEVKGLQCQARELDLMLEAGKVLSREFG